MAVHTKQLPDGHRGERRYTELITYGKGRPCVIAYTTGVPGEIGAVFYMTAYPPGYARPGAGQPVRYSLIYLRTKEKLYLQTADGENLPWCSCWKHPATKTCFHLEMVGAWEKSLLPVWPTGKE